MSSTDRLIFVLTVLAAVALGGILMWSVLVISEACR